MEDELDPLQMTDTAHMTEDPTGAADGERGGREGFYAANEVPDELRPVYDDMERALNRKFEDLAKARKENQAYIDAGQLLLRAQQDPSARNLLLAQLGVNGQSAGPEQRQDDTPSYMRDIKPEEWDMGSLQMMERIADERSRRVAMEVARQYEERLAPFTGYVETQQKDRVRQKVAGLTEKYGKELVQRHTESVFKLMGQGIDMEAAFRAVAHEDIQRQEAARAARERHTLQRRDQEATLTTDDRVAPQTQRSKNRRGALVDMVRDVWKENGLLS